MLMRSIPAAASFSAYLGNWEPLVVKFSSLSDVVCFNAPICSINQSTLRRTKGSPPVMRTFSTPSSQKAFTRKAISSSVSNCSRGMKVISSSMQYTQRKSQRSVIDIRTYDTRRPKLSINCVWLSVIVSIMR